MRFFKMEDFRVIQNVINTRFETIPPLIQCVLANFKQDEHRQILFCVVEQFANLDMEDTTYLVAINENSYQNGEKIVVIGDYKKDYLHNLLFCCEYRSLEVVFKGFFNEKKV